MIMIVIGLDVGVKERKISVFKRGTCPQQELRCGVLWAPFQIIFFFGDSKAGPHVDEWLKYDASKAHCQVVIVIL